MFKRHFFLVFAVGLIVLMAAAAAYKVLGPKKAGPGGPGAPSMAGAGRPGQGGPGGAGGPPGGAGGRGAPVTPVAVSVRPFADKLEVLGVAKGRQSVTLTSNTTEMVEAVRFRPGDRVAKGQVLIDLRQNEEDAQIVQAQSTLSQAKADADRWAALAERGVAPRATAEQFQAAYRSAQANLRVAEARRGDRVIRAPFSGTIGLSDVAPGALISPGTVIASLDDATVIRVDFDVPDRFLSVLREGMPITARSDTYPDVIHKGVIAKIDTRVDERTRAIKARAEFQNGDGKLKPGMLMRVGIDRGSRETTAVPESAVQFTGDRPFVFVIAQRDKGFIAEQRGVLTGAIEGGFVEIREGLKAGERVVADGLNRIQPGQPIMIGGGSRPGGAGQGAGAPGASKTGGAGPNGASAPRTAGAPG